MSQASEGAPAPTWRVTGQVEQSQVNASGQLSPGVRVSFTTGAGHSGSIWVPNTAYSVETVRTMIANQAGILDAVGSLTGGA